MTRGHIENLLVVVWLLALACGVVGAWLNNRRYDARRRASRHVKQSTQGLQAPAVGQRRLLLILDALFSSLAIVTSGVIGNALVARHIPPLPENMGWLSKSVVAGLTAPSALADWSLGFLPAASLPMLLVVLLLGEASLVLFTPLLGGTLAAGLARHSKVTIDEAYRVLEANPDLVRSVRAEVTGRVAVGVLGKTGVMFISGLLAAAIAWGVVLLVSLHVHGIFRTACVVVAIAVLVVLYEFLNAVTSELTDDEAVISRVGELSRQSRARPNNDFDADSRGQ